MRRIFVASGGIRKFFLFADLLVLATLIAELSARHFLGLGDPPPVMRHPTIEYMFVPGKSYRRFGNLVAYNSVGMRALEPPTDGKMRVLVMGDSVVNGGSLLDQSEIATSVLQKDLGKDWWVGNNSAGSWGPLNLLAYTQVYGWFVADLAIVVLSTHDLTDLPQFSGDLGSPETKPIPALHELITRYGWRLIRELTPGFAKRDSTKDDQTFEQGRAALAALLTRGMSNTKHFTAVLHPTRAEIGREAGAQRRALRTVLEQTGVRYVDLQSSPEWTSEFYLDDIHLNALGHRALAGVLECMMIGTGEVIGLQRECDHIGTHAAASK